MERRKTARKCVFISSIFIFVLLAACNQNSNQQQYYVEKEKKNKEPLIKANKYLVKKDNQVIQNYIKRRKWDMSVTKTGLWYQILEHGKGDSVKSGNIVTFAYKIFLLDGTLCYSSDSLGLKTFVVGKTSIEPGMQEGIRMLKQGDKARFILQPFLAHGLVGDKHKIPPRATIIYELELMDVKNIR